MSIKLKKVWCEKWKTEDGRYSVSITHNRIKGLYPKYYVSGGLKFNTHVSTLKEARAVIEKWESERTEKEGK